MPSFYIGIDLHHTVIQACVLDDRGERVEERRFVFDGLEEGLLVVGFLASYGSDIRVAVEALGLNRWFVNACLERSIDVLVCDPRKLDLKKLGRKTDKRDAQEIARRLYLGDLDRMATTYYPTDEEYAARKLLRVRHKLIQLRQQTTNQLRGTLMAYQLEAPTTVLYTGPSQEKLSGIKMPAKELQAPFDALRAVLRSLQEQILVLDREVDRKGRRDPDIVVMKESLPSVGAQTAATILAELGDPKRFGSARAVAAYAGLVPRVAQSADRAHHGKMTKQGNPELRWVLSQWAVRLLTKDPVVREWAAVLRKRVHKNKVRMALARRLLVGVWAMLRTGEAFDLRRCLGMPA